MHAVECCRERAHFAPRADPLERKLVDRRDHRLCRNLISREYQMCGAATKLLVEADFNRSIEHRVSECDEVEALLLLGLRGVEGDVIVVAQIAARTRLHIARDAEIVDTAGSFAHLRAQMLQELREEALDICASEDRRPAK